PLLGEDLGEMVSPFDAFPRRLRPGGFRRPDGQAGSEQGQEARREEQQGGGGGAGASAGGVSASISSSAVAKRSAGWRSRQRRIAAFQAGSRAVTRSLGGGAGSLRRFIAVKKALVPMKGSSPVTISYSTTPSA